jgi:hypothetical protein
VSSIYLEPVALRTVQLVNVECLALTRAYQAYRSSLQVVCSRGSEHPEEDHGVFQLSRPISNKALMTIPTGNPVKEAILHSMKEVSNESGLSKKADSEPILFS